MKNTKQLECALIFNWNGYIPFCPYFVQLSKKYSKCGKSSSDRSWPAWQKLVGHLFLPRIDVISAIELNRHTPKWNLHVKQKGIWRHWGHRENKENQDCDMICPWNIYFFGFANSHTVPKCSRRFSRPAALFTTEAVFSNQRRSEPTQSKKTSRIFISDPTINTILINLNSPTERGIFVLILTNNWPKDLLGESAAWLCLPCPCKALGKRTQHCCMALNSQYCWMLHAASVCTPCCMSLGVVASVWTPLPTRTQQLPTSLARQSWELLRLVARSLRRFPRRSHSCILVTHPLRPRDPKCTKPHENA